MSYERFIVYAFLVGFVAYQFGAIAAARKLRKQFAVHMQRLKELEEATAQRAAQATKQGEKP